MPEFTREKRYEVMKIADLEAIGLTAKERILLQSIRAKILLHRAYEGKPELECVVVEKGWPEYEPTWLSIERRMTCPSS